MSNSTYLEAKHVEIYLPGGRLCLILTVRGKLRRMLPIWRPNKSKSTYLEVDYVESLGVRPGYAVRFVSLAMSAGWV